jgi:NADH-quinone oxidoreductase subunit H
LVPVVSVGSLNLATIGDYQQGLLNNWLIFNNPFTFIAFFVYFTVATAGCKRAPFDLAEAESELVGGFHTEYSGMRWSFFFMAEYAAMFLVSMVAAILFLGGWNTGLPIESSLDFLRSPKWEILGGFNVGIYLLHLIGMVVVVTKASILVCVQIWVRWTFPRLRIDQVMMTCLKYLVPISCFLFLGATLWPLFLLELFGRTSFTTKPLGDLAPQAVSNSPAPEDSTRKPIIKQPTAIVSSKPEFPAERTDR